MRGLPDERKAALRQQIAAREPDTQMRLSGAKDIEQALLKLRRDRFVLIDLQHENTAITSVWYRKGDGLLLGRRRPEVTMLVQEEKAGGASRVLAWLL